MTTSSRGENFKAHPCILFPYNDGRFKTIQKPIAPFTNNPLPKRSLQPHLISTFIYTSTHKLLLQARSCEKRFKWQR